jgi:predicted DNA binding protein
LLIEEAVSMAIIVAFTLPAKSFPFGRSTSGDTDVRVQLERVIPLKEGRIPFIWATGKNFEQFEHVLKNSDVVNHFETVTKVGDSVLYYTVWNEENESFLNGLAELDVTILEGHGNGTWSFTVRFKTHADLTRFHQFYQNQNFPVHIERVTSLEEDPGVRYGFDLSPEQRDALMMAVEEGYFSVPRKITLDEIAEELNISSQAASERVRRGAQTVLRKALVGLVAEDFGPADEEEQPI